MRDLGNRDASFHLVLLKMVWFRKKKCFDAASVDEDIDVDNDVEMKEETNSEVKSDEDNKVLPQLKQLVKILNSMNNAQKSEQFVKQLDFPQLM